MKITQTIQTIERDFEEQRGPFSDVTFPEERLLEEIPYSTLEGNLRILSAFCTFDYNRDANQLVDNLIELWETDPYKFEPGSVPLVEYEDELAEIFSEIGFRYPSRDAHAWCKNNAIIRDEYNGGWTELLLETGCDAEALVERLSDDDFLCLKGVKIAPMYARIIDDFVCDLEGVWALDIPVDTHIRRLSHDLFGDDLSDDRIREEWRGLAIETDISREIVDGALWHIGNKWDEWGEDYWQDVTEGVK